jgi:uncharacterized protein
MIVGRANPEATKAFAEKHSAQEGYPSTSYRAMGRSNLVGSEIGFGCYRIDAEDEEHRKALLQALRHGCNLIDTSTNYSDGSSETCVGLVLEQAIKEKLLTREQVIVVSKAGYLQGRNLEIAQQREIERSPLEDVVKYMDGCWHCIHPDFLSEQIGRSLQRLNLDCIDVYLLHNPEYFFADATHRQVKEPLPVLRGQFYERIRKAFAHLEEEVANGRIGCYGVSSNTFGAIAGDPEGTSLWEMWHIAAEVAKRRTGDANDHHFSFAQLPANLFEGCGMLVRNNGIDHTHTAMEFAKERNIALLVNRPLNSIVNGSLVRLADYDIEGGHTQLDIKALAEQVSKKEMTFMETLAGQLPKDFSGKPERLFAWGSELSKTSLDSIGLEQWHQIQSQYIIPQVHSVVRSLNQYFENHFTTEWCEWRDVYLSEMKKLLKMIEKDCTKRSQSVSNNISQRLDPFLPEDMRKYMLSQKSLAVLANTEGVSCVLNGMRSEAYVRDSMGVMKMKPFPVKAELFESFKE